jgi:hypothetical protein
MITPRQRAIYAACGIDVTELEAWEREHDEAEQRQRAEQAEPDDGDAEAQEWAATVDAWQSARRERGPGERVVYRDWGSPRERSAPAFDDDEDDPLMRIAITLADETVEALARQRQELLLQIDALRTEIGTLRREVETLREAQP